MYDEDKSTIDFYHISMISSLADSYYCQHDTDWNTYLILNYYRNVLMRLFQETFLLWCNLSTLLLKLIC